MAYQDNRNNNKGPRINEMIRVREIRLIDDEGEQKGIVPTIEALKLAKERDLDLVEVSPNANPPVCKILDYGKYRFEQEKKLRESKKNQKVLKLKEIRMQPKIGPGDLDTKAKHVQEFLDEGDKVKVTIRFRGRELAHTAYFSVCCGKTASNGWKNNVHDNQCKSQIKTIEVNEMPKMKTKKSAAKRYSLTGTGKVKYKKQNLRHILTKRSPKRKRQLRETGILAEADAKKIRKQMLPYG